MRASGASLPTNTVIAQKYLGPRPDQYSGYVPALMSCRSAWTTVVQVRRDLPFAEPRKARHMYAQLTYFDGPRSPELVAANDRADRERILPAMMAAPLMQAQLIANYTLRQPDGGQVVVTITSTAEALDRGGEIIMSTELLPGEDPLLLPGPDRVERYEVVDSTIGQALVH